MSNKNTFHRVNYDGFFGIDTRRCHGGKENLYDINNFRVKDDDSLEKRAGFQPVFSSEDTIRNVWSGNLNGEFLCFFLAGSTVYRFNTRQNEAVSIGTIGESVKKPSFFYFKDALFLIDEISIYRITKNFVHEAIGYVPLLGKDWPTTTMGEPLEEFNILNSCGRISYLIPKAYTGYLHTLRKADRIIAVYLNGQPLDPSNYFYKPEYTSIGISCSLKEGDRIVACLHYELGEAPQIQSCTAAGVFGGIYDSRLLLWGGSNPNKIFINENVEDESLAESEAIFPNCCGLYFPEGKSFAVGDGRYEIKALIRHFDRMLIMTEGEAWMASNTVTGKEEFPAMNINSSVGCASDMGVVRIGNDPVSIGHHSVMRWTSETDKINECNAYSISKQIEDRLSPEFFKKAIVFLDERRQEIWFHNNTLDSNVWIYNIKKSCWVRFSGISASSFFDTGNDIGFASGNTLYIFSDEYNSDIFNGDVLEIIGSISAYNLDFDTSQIKRLSRVILSGELDSGSAVIKMETGEGEKIEAVLESKQQHSIIEERIHSSRFSFLRSLYVKAGGKARQVLHRMNLDAR